jgi:hypothetical protein
LSRSSNKFEEDDKDSIDSREDADCSRRSCGSYSFNQREGGVRWKTKRRLRSSPIYEKAPVAGSIVEGTIPCEFYSVEKTTGVGLSIETVSCSRSIWRRSEVMGFRLTSNMGSKHSTQNGLPM